MVTPRSTALQFAADGDTAGAAGFNGAGNKNRLVAFSATPDANGRSAYTNSVTTGAASVALNPTDVLRAGTHPVQRVSSSGSAITALLDDTNSPEVINYVFSASLPTPTQQATAASNGWGYLHVVEIGNDAVEIAADGASTNAPAGLSAQDLLDIYTGADTTWNELPGNSGGSTATIVPLIPPSGSSIYKTFIADLTTANGGTAPTLSTSVKTVEQNAPICYHRVVEFRECDRSVLRGAIVALEQRLLLQPRRQLRPGWEPFPVAPRDQQPTDPGREPARWGGARWWHRVRQPDHRLRDLPPE